MRDTMRLAVVCLALALAGPVGAGSDTVGTIFFGDLQLRGVLETTGRAVGDGELLRTLDRWGMLHLANGQVLRVEANTAVAFEDAGAGTIEVRVLAGKLTMVGPGGRLLRAGSGSRFTLRPSDGDALADEAELAAVSSARNPRSRAGGRSPASRRAGDSAGR